MTGKSKTLQFVLVLGLIILAAISYLPPKTVAFTPLSGHITSSATLTLSNSPYRVVGNLTVDSGVALTIQPGVTVQIADRLNILVDGSLNAIGTSNNLITFTSNDTSPTPGAWNTTSFTGGTGSNFKLQYAVVRFAKNGVTIASGQGYASIQNSDINSNSQDAILVKGTSNLVITGNSLRQNGGGIGSDFASLHSGIAISNNRITNNIGNGVFLNSLGQINTTSPTATINNVTFAGNDIESNGLDGVYLYSYTPMFQNNYSLITSQASITSVTLTGDTISGNGGDGFALQDFSSTYSNPYTSTSFNTANIAGIGISSMTATSNHGIGIRMEVSTSAGSHGYSTLSDVNIVASTVKYNGGGVYLSSHEDGANDAFAQVLRVRVSSTTISNNGYGLRILAHSFGRASAISHIEIASSTVSHNSGDGAAFQSSVGMSLHYTSAVTDLLFTNDSVTYNSGNGVYLSADPGYPLPGTISDLAIVSGSYSYNQGNGIYAYADGFKNLLQNMTITSATISSNGQNGLFVRASSGDGATVTKTVFSSNSMSGIDTGSSSGSVNSTLTRSFVFGNQYGVSYNGPSIKYSNLAFENDIYSNFHGMNVTNGATVNATNNYWGASSGPYNPSANPGGSGNPVNGNGTDLLFKPFLTLPSSLVSFYLTPSSVGTITFSNNTFTNGQTDHYLYGNYTAVANAPPGYHFISWTVTGSVTASSLSNPSTTVTVRGPGTLTATFAKTPQSTTLSPSVILLMGTFTTVVALAQRIRTSSQVSRRPI